MVMMVIFFSMLVTHLCLKHVYVLIPVSNFTERNLWLLFQEVGGMISIVKAQFCADVSYQLLMKTTDIFFHQKYYIVKQGDRRGNGEDSFMEGIFLLCKFLKYIFMISGCPVQIVESCKLNFKQMLCCCRHGFH